MPDTTSGPRQHLMTSQIRKFDDRLPRQRGGLKMQQLNKAVRDLLSGLHGEESGQDLIEYAMIAALIALAATAGMGTVAAAVNGVFSSVGVKIRAYIV